MYSKITNSLTEIFRSKISGSNGTTNSYRSGKSRRQILKYGVLSAGMYYLSYFSWIPFSSRLRFLRPPGALVEDDFQKKCIRCGLCKDVCPNQCIDYFDVSSGTNSGTPYIVPRKQGCILCMKCNNACPSGALQPLKDDIESIKATVNMGVASLDKNICYSYNDRICGVCYRACPLQDIALKIGPWETPIIDTEKCVGCGLCERICYHYPQAIRIIPANQQV